MASVALNNCQILIVAYSSVSRPARRGHDRKWAHPAQNSSIERTLKRATLGILPSAVALDMNAAVVKRFVKMVVVAGSGKTNP